MNNSYTEPSIFGAVIILVDNTIAWFSDYQHILKILVVVYLSMGIINLSLDMRRKWADRKERKLKENVR